ncbi:MAG: universal stress protein [Desulfobacterales bacterium]|nr:universal stress protein [Desulfobacterales bacterium]
MNIQKLLFVTKFEELGFDALQALLGLRKAALNHVVFVNVIERDKVAMRRGTGYQKTEEVRLRELANIRFIDWAETLFEQGMEVGVYIVVGTLVSQVIEAAKKEDADLIVIGKSHKPMLEQFYSGSDVTEIIRRASIPVLVYKPVPENNTALEHPFERPLLATDNSAGSLRAVEYFKGLNAVVEEIHLLTVVDEKALKGDSSMSIQKSRKEARQRLEQICEELESVGIRARAHVYVGQPFEQIERAARDCQATLIVAGSSAKAAWAERWIGSVPRAIAEKSVYPTMLVPPDKS